MVINGHKIQCCEANSWFFYFSGWQSQMLQFAMDAMDSTWHGGGPRGSDYNGWEAIFDYGNLKKIPIIMAVIGKGFYICELYYILCCFQRFDYVWLCLTGSSWVFLFLGGPSNLLMAIFCTRFHRAFCWRSSRVGYTSITFDGDVNRPMILSHGPRIMMIECMTLTTFNHYPFMTLTTVCPWIFPMNCRSSGRPRCGRPLCGSTSSSGRRRRIRWRLGHYERFGNLDYMYNMYNIFNISIILVDSKPMSFWFLFYTLLYL